MAGFLDKVVGGINKGVTAVSEGSKTLVEKATINTQLQELDKEKKALMQNLGMLVYNLMLNGEIQIEQCNGMCAEIHVCDQKISELSAQLQSLEAPKAAYAQSAGGAVCACGAVNQPGARFCSKCGSPLQANQ